MLECAWPRTFLFPPPRRRGANLRLRPSGTASRERSSASGCSATRTFKLTSPTASNKQEIRVFVFTAEGVCEYLNAENSLRPVVQGDHRDLVAGRQGWVKTAPVILLMVADEKKFGGSDERSTVVMGVDAGIVSENINLFCAGAGLVTRPRMSMDTQAIKELLRLDETQTPLLNNPVGYAR